MRRPITTRSASLPTALPSSGARADSTHSTYRLADANPSPNGATGASPSGAICANRANGPTGPTKLGSTNAPTNGFSSEGEESVKAVEGPEVAINIAVPTMPAKTPTEILRENMAMFASFTHARAQVSLV